MEVSLEGVSVFVAMPAHRAIPVPTVLSITGTVGMCIGSGIPIRIAIPAGGSVISAARNRAAHLFLKTDCSHCFWIDSDIQWRPESFLRILAMATQRAIARAVYPKRREPITFDADGLGFTCMQRQVLEAVAKDAPMIFYGEDEPCKELFREGIVETERAKKAGAEKEFVAEDAEFIGRAAKLGFQPWIDSSIELGHVGEKIYYGTLKDYLAK